MTLIRTVIALVFVVLSIQAPNLQAAERIKPFVLAATSDEPVAVVTQEASEALTDAGYQILAAYQPFDDATVLVFTSAALQEAAAATDLGGFGAVLRAAVTAVDGQTQLSYVNPVYLAQAYRLDSDLAEVSAELEEVLGAETTFGSKKGLKPKQVRSYHYMLGMEYFDDTYALGKFDSQDAAVAAVVAGLESNSSGLSQVYRLDLPDQGAVLFGVAMAPEGEDDKFFNDAYQMSVVDFGELRSTAYLPYEILVKDGAVQSLHMRFRMAVHFPDLSMMGKHSFMTLMPSPDAIEKALKSLINP